MKNYTLLAALTFLSTSVMAEIISVDIINLDSGKSTGIVTISESDYGTVFTPKLKDLPVGIHGFHIHSNASCESSVKNGKIIQGGAAGGHYDPKETGKHGFPWTSYNHLGDLPALYVGIDGVANQPVLAPRVKLSDVKGRALMVHLGGDNHSDHPNKLGGGGSRVLCGVIK